MVGVGGWRLEVGGWRLEVGGWRFQGGGGEWGDYSATAVTDSTGGSVPGSRIQLSPQSALA
jgi:hypothetical protein